MMETIRKIFGTKLTTVLAIIAAILGVLTGPEFADKIPTNWSAWLLTAATVVGFLSKSAIDADGNGWPDFIDRLLGRVPVPPAGRPGFASTRLLGMLALIGVVVLVGCNAMWRGKPTPVSLRPGVTWQVQQFAADSTVATASCGDAAWRAATAVSTCEWQVTRNGTAVTVPAGFTARVVLTGEPGAAATFVASARGRNPINQTGPWSPTAERVVTIGYPNITAPTITWVVTGS